MKRSRVLNRPMFNKHNSAYGRGIASNLVTDEQRQRFNYGGRVGLQEGSGYGFKDFRESPIGGFLGDMYRNVPGALADFAYTPINLAGRLVGYNPGLSARKHIRTSKDLMYGKDREDRMTDEEVEKTSFFGIPFSAKRGFTSERRKKEAEKKDEKKGEWADRLTLKADEPGATGAEEVDTTTLDVADWTPKEKEEKKRDVALAMAERLIGGSRDKWGSTAQMKNLAGALGDVRKITDKEDIRKDQRKYRAYAEAQKDIAKSLEKGKGYSSFQAEGMRPGDALYRSAGIDSITIPKGKGAKKAIEKVKSGDVIYDENDSQWKIMTPDGLVTVTVDKIVEANRRGDLAELKETSINVEEKGR